MKLPFLQTIYQYNNISVITTRFQVRPWGFGPVSKAERRWRQAWLQLTPRIPVDLDQNVILVVF